MLDCVWLYYFMRWLPIINHAPTVLFLVSLQPAQLLSEYVVILDTGSCHLKVRTALGLPDQYLPILLTRKQSFTLGHDILLLHSLDAYCRSDLSWAKKLILAVMAL